MCVRARARRRRARASHQSLPKGLADARRKPWTTTPTRLRFRRRASSTATRRTGWSAWPRWRTSPRRTATTASTKPRRAMSTRVTRARCRSREAQGSSPRGGTVVLAPCAYQPRYRTYRVPCDAPQRTARRWHHRPRAVALQAPSNRWHPCKYSTDVVRRFLRTQFDEYAAGVRKADCHAELRRRLGKGPPVCPPTILT